MLAFPTANTKSYWAPHVQVPPEFSNLQQTEMLKACQPTEECPTVLQKYYLRDVLNTETQRKI